MPVENMEAMRSVFVFSTLGMILLFLYQVTTFIHLLKNEALLEKQGYYGLIYTAIILMLPLGIGAAIYDRVVRERLSKLFFIGFSISITTLSIVYLKSLKHANHFEFLTI